MSALNVELTLVFDVRPHNVRWHLVLRNALLNAETDTYVCGTVDTENSGAFDREDAATVFVKLAPWLPEAEVHEALSLAKVKHKRYIEALAGTGEVREPHDQWLEACRRERVARTDATRAQWKRTRGQAWRRFTKAVENFHNAKADAAAQRQTR